MKDWRNDVDVGDDDQKPTKNQLPSVKGQSKSNDSIESSKLNTEVDS